MKVAKISLATLIIFLALILVVLSSQQINLATADLGRHIKNGEIFFQNFSVPQNNFYSYTNIDYPFINHHWGSGVIFYLIYLWFGFNGISVFFVVTSLITFLIFFVLALKNSNPTIAAISTVLLIPIITSRVEVRPEVFSFLFLGIFFWILWHYCQANMRRIWLYFLPIIILIWVNLHIYFFLGIALIGAFLVDRVINYLIKKNKETAQQIKWLFIILIFSGLASLINPAGIKGALYPLKIFENYGYRLFENQSIWFIEKLVAYPPALYFKFAFAALLISWLLVVYAGFSRHQKLGTGLIIANLIISCVFGAAGFLAIRNFPLMGYFALPIIASNLQNFIKTKAEESVEKEYFTTTILCALIFIVLMIANPGYLQSKNDTGLGVEPGVNNAANFFKEKGIVGPIFNNYDIGGYLIYHLYPKERIFVDNRPEAYPRTFFEEIYVPMQEKDEIWQKKSKKYNFNAIFFYKNDFTPWAQSFLIQRVSDPNWAPVYVDNYNIIFLRRTNQNQSIIQKYELPKNIFNLK